MYILIIVIFLISEVIIGTTVHECIRSGILTENWNAITVIPLFIIEIIAIRMLIKCPNKLLDMLFNENPNWFGPKIKNPVWIWLQIIGLLIVTIYIFLESSGITHFNFLHH